MADHRTPLINSIVSSAVELREAAAAGKDLAQNYKSILGGKDPFAVSEIRGYIGDFVYLLPYISAEALGELPVHRLHELHTALNNIYAKLSELHNFVRTPDRTDQDQQRTFIQFFQNNDAGFYVRSREIAWQGIVEGITLSNRKTLNNTEHIGKANANASEIANILGDMKKLQATAKEEAVKTGISKHAGIFDDQAKTHRTNASLWGFATIILIAANFKLLFYFYGEVGTVEKVSVQLAILILLVISLVSYGIVVTVRSYFAEKHNQTINRHKANCLGTYETFTESAPDDIKSVILQYTTQTIFSQFNPGYLNSSKDPIQSPSPTIELLRTITSEKKS
jgi:hypothetical protein